MGKKYLDTKKDSLEQSVLGVWKSAVEEGTARMDGRTTQYREHRKKLESARARRESIKTKTEAYEIGTDEYRKYLETLTPGETIEEDLDPLTDEELDSLTDEEFDLFELDNEMFEAAMKKKSAGERKAAAKKRAKWAKTPAGKKSKLKAKKRAAKIRSGAIKVDPKRARAAKKRAKLYSGDNIEEKSGGKEEYKKFFDSALKKFKIDSPADLKSDEEKKKFYDYIDKNWTGDHEEAFKFAKESKAVSIIDTVKNMWNMNEKTKKEDDDKEIKGDKTLTGKKSASIEIDPDVKEKHKK